MFQLLKDNLCLHLARVSDGFKTLSSVQNPNRRNHGVFQALDIECDTVSVCAYLEFIAVNLKSTQSVQPEKFQEYVIMQVVADIVVNRRDLRDAVFSGRGNLLSADELHRIRMHTVTLLETFMESACETTPEMLGDCAGDSRVRTICIC